MRLQLAALLDRRAGDKLVWVEKAAQRPTRRSLLRKTWGCRIWLLLVLAAGMSAWSQPAPAQQRWAAIDPNSEGSSTVAWGPTEDEARQRAVEACKRVSKTCANGPASTQDMKEVFAVMCCTQPRVGCAASAAGNRRDALKNVQEMFAEAGYRECSVRHYMSAATGRKQ